MSVGHPRGTHSRYVIGCCLIPLGICGLKNNSKRITYEIGCVWGMPSLSPLSSLAKTQYSFDTRSILRADVSKYRTGVYKSEKNENSQKKFTK